MHTASYEFVIKARFIIKPEESPKHHQTLSSNATLFYQVGSGHKSNLASAEMFQMVPGNEAERNWNKAKSNWCYTCNLTVLFPHFLWLGS